jgi:hypothetical protein
MSGAILSTAASTALQFAFQLIEGLIQSEGPIILEKLQGHTNQMTLTYTQGNAPAAPYPNVPPPNLAPLPTPASQVNAPVSQYPAEETTPVTPTQETETE